jgi:hypothetical protein
MAVTSFTSLLGLALPTTGDLSGTWGTTVNDSITNLLDSAVAGTTTLSTDGDVTLTSTNGSSNQARQAIILLSGARTAARNVTAPAQSKAYIVNNATTGGYAVTFRGSGPTTGVSILNGEKCLVAWNGSDFVKVSSSYGGVSVATSNGFAGTNSAGTLTLTTTVTGITKGNGTALSAATAGTDYLAPPSGTAILKANSGGALANATAGTDYVAPGTVTTFTAQQNFAGTSSNLASVLTNAAEKVTVSATAATGTINYDIATQTVLYYTSNATANWTTNFRLSSGTTLNSSMATGECITVVFLVPQGSTAYYNNAITVDGSAPTVYYQGNTAFSTGIPSSVNAYTYSIIKTASATFTVFVSQVKFAT